MAVREAGTEELCEPVRGVLSEASNLGILLLLRPACVATIARSYRPNGTEYGVREPLRPTWFGELIPELLLPSQFLLRVHQVKRARGACGGR